jgi:hypothetical protein
MKVYNNNILDQIYDDRFIAVDLVEIHLKNQLGTNTPLYLTNANFSIAYDSPTAPTAGSNVYTAQGEFMGYSTVPEEFDVKVGKFSIYLSAINNNYINLFTQNEIEGKRVVIYKAFLEYNNLTIIPDPIILFDGIIMNIAITESSRSCSIGIDCSTLFSDYERTNGRKTNNNSNWLFQGVEYDKAMDKTGFTGNTELKWGRT